MRCSECGFVYGSISRDAVPSAMREIGPKFARRLVGHDDAALRRRPAPDTWSALEYACHVRDVLLVLRERVLLVLRDPEPVFTPMGRDERVVHDRYADQEAADVARQLTDAAGMLAFVVEGLAAEQWERGCVYGYPAPAWRSLAWVLQHAVHEGEHHLADVDASLGTA